jgi:hypothetical protein
MGRPPVGERAMTATERQRRWRQQKRAQAAADPPHESDDQAEAEPERRSPPPPQPVAPSVDQALEKLTRERDQAWKERNELRQELELVTEQRDDLVRNVMPKPELVGDHLRACWCSFCGKRWGDDPEVEIMIVGSVRQRLFFCSECIEGRCAEIIAEARQRKAAQGLTTREAMDQIKADIKARLAGKS